MSSDTPLPITIDADKMRGMVLRLLVVTGIVAFFMAALSGVDILLGYAADREWTVAPAFLPALVVLAICLSLPWLGLGTMEAQRQRLLAQRDAAQRQRAKSYRYSLGAILPPRQAVQEYRNFIREAIGFRPDSRTIPYPDPLYVWLDELYRQIRFQRWNDSLSMVVAVGLMTYGRLDAIETALQGINDPHHPGELHEMAINCFLSVLPVPDEMKYNRPIDTVALADWLDQHYAQLCWDTNLSRFALAAVHHKVAKVS